MILKRDIQRQDRHCIKTLQIHENYLELEAANHAVRTQRISKTGLSGADNFLRRRDTR